MRRFLIGSVTGSALTFPVSGDDLTARGVTPGRELGRMLQMLERHWIATGFSTGRDELMKMLDADEMNR